jgi:capsular polysaccharide biosynthesis protein
MRPEEVVPEVARRWWIIALAALAAAIAGYGLAAGQPEEYTVSARVAASAEPADYWLDLYAKSRLSAYAPLIDNYAFVQDALQAANLSIDPGLAQSKMRLSHAANTNTVTITVVDSDGQRAADIANAIQAAFIAWNEQQNASLVARVESEEDPFPARVVIVSLGEAGAPATPNGVAVRSTTIAAALLGAVAGCVIIFFLMYRDDTLKTERDVQRYLERPLLAVLPADEPALRGLRGH